MGDEDVGGVEEGGGFPVDLAVGEEDCWVDVGGLAGGRLGGGEGGGVGRRGWW